MDKHLALFEKALTLYEEVKTKKSEIFFDSSSDSDECSHFETMEELCRTICVNCGQIITENFISIPHYTGAGMKKRKKDECSIYNDIPSHIPQHIKDETINIYLRVMKGEKHRSTAPKRAIILACLYHAALRAKNDISYDDLLEMFRMPQQIANKGFATVVSSNIVNIKETISDANEEKNIIKTILRNLNILSYTQPVTALYLLVKNKSTLLHTSLVKSVVAGCIYFWIRHKNSAKTLKRLSQDMEMSQHTVLGKYINITEIVMLSVMKELFSGLLHHSTPVVLEKCKYRQFFKENPESLCVNISEKKAIVVKPFDSTGIKVFKYENELKKENEFPLDDVDDILEWNIFLNNKYFGSVGSTTTVRTLNITVTKNSKDVVLNFEEYNNMNNKNGNQIYRNIVDKKIDLCI